jgi:hypothetical protein
MHPSGKCLAKMIINGDVRIPEMIQAFNNFDLSTFLKKITPVIDDVIIDAKYGVTSYLSLLIIIDWHK